MKRVIMIAVLSIFSLHVFAADNAQLAEQCQVISKQLAQLTMVPKQKLKCHPALLGLSTSTYTASQMIKHNFKSPATTTLQKTILGLEKVEGLKCAGGFMITEAKLALIEVEDKLHS